MERKLNRFLTPLCSVCFSGRLHQLNIIEHHESTCSHTLVSASCHGTPWSPRIAFCQIFQHSILIIIIHVTNSTSIFRRPHNTRVPWGHLWAPSLSHRTFSICVAIRPDLYIFIYIHTYVYIHIYICTHTHTHTHTHTIHTYIYTDMGFQPISQGHERKVMYKWDNCVQ